MTRSIRGLSDIRDRFDAVLTDQYGVLHDGRAPFDGAVEALAWLAERRIPVAVLTNSGRSPAANEKRLRSLGFAAAHYGRAITSGGLAASRLAEMLQEGSLSPGDEVLVVESSSRADVLESLPLEPAVCGERARLILIAGADPARHSRRDYAERLRPLAQRGVPALCCNPDQAIYGPGGARFGPGRIADDYRAAGGSVAMLGKPDPAMFRAGLRAVGDPAPGRCLMVGDSPVHDVAGAKRAGCLALHVTEGVQSGTTDESAAADFAIPRLRP